MHVTSHRSWNPQKRKSDTINIFKCQNSCMQRRFHDRPLCILATHFRGEEVDPRGALTLKEPGNLFWFFLFFFILNLAISHFLEVPVSLTHSQGPSQSPFVNRAMFYNSPSLSDDHINNAEEPHLSGAMRLFLWFGLTVMVIVWQTIYSSNNAHRLQLFSDQRDCRGAHDWLLTKRQSQAVQPPTSHFCLAALIMEKNSSIP